MPSKHLYGVVTTLVILSNALFAAPTLAQQAGSILESATLANGRCTITGTALAANGNATCALALASGRCMFTCGPGSLRCEGGTASLPFGKFQLNDLALESDGTVNLQIFAQGNISHTRKITCSGGSAANARWNSYNNTCCRNSAGTVFASTYEVTMDGVTKQSVSSSCTSSSSTETFSGATPGTKSFTSRVSSSACGTSTASGTVTMASNACYQFQLSAEGGSLVNRFGTVNCPASAEATAFEADTETTPMAIFPMLSADDGSGTPLASYQPLQQQ
ncbi:MAG: hypothetical protein WAT67_13730 [Candidatus Contendobacter sp.]